jgi:hypothetical protein
MCRKSYLAISSVIFGLAAIAHLARLIYHLPIRVGDWTVPLWLSWAGVPVAGILSGWAFCVLCRKCE